MPESLQSALCARAVSDTETQTVSSAICVHAGPDQDKSVVSSVLCARAVSDTQRYTRTAMLFARLRTKNMLIQIGMFQFTSADSDSDTGRLVELQADQITSADSDMALTREGWSSGTLFDGLAIV